MYYLHRRKFVQPPLPGLAIQLHGPADKVYRTGDLVEGNVVITPVQLMNPTDITVALWGWSETWMGDAHGGRPCSLNDDESHRDLAPLFSLSTNVAEGSMLPYLEPGQAYTFPVSFRFPGGFWYTRHGIHKKDCDKHERLAPDPHDLPPTF